MQEPRTSVASGMVWWGLQPLSPAATISGLFIGFKSYPPRSCSIYLVAFDPVSLAHSGPCVGEQTFLTRI